MQREMSRGNSAGRDHVVLVAAKQQKKRDYASSPGWAAYWGLRLRFERLAWVLVGFFAGLITGLGINAS
jgi:hypothetical protein